MMPGLDMTLHDLMDGWIRISAFSASGKKDLLVMDIMGMTIEDGLPHLLHNDGKDIFLLLLTQSSTSAIMGRDGR